MFAAVAVDEGTVVVPDDPGADWWLLLGEDPVGEVWWDPADTGAESGGEVSVDLEAASAPWESAACLEAVAPGAGLASVLERVDLPSADDELVVEFVAAAEKLAAWGHLRAAEGAAELARRASMNPDWRRPIPTRTCVAGDELAMRLGWSRPAAARLVRAGQALGNELLLVAEAVRAGRVDSQKLRVLTDRLHDRPGQLAWAVQEAVLPEVAERTPTQLAADIDRALLAVDPQDAALRLPRALARRHVCHPRRLPDGMAGLWAVLPATDAARIDATLEATARAARALGDPRTLDQLRADTLTDLATGTALLAGATLAQGHDGAQPSAARQVTNRGDTAADPVGDQDALAHAMSAAPIPDLNGYIAGEATARGETPLSPLADDGPPDRKAPGIRVPKVRIDVTVALSTLLGLDDQPGELAGLGPISAEQARALAAGGIWRRIVTDPLTGAVLDVGRTRYRPPRPLAEHVIARDGSCAAPGCTVPGHRCDLDHTTEYHGRPANGSPVRGKTAADNLGPLSDRCHRLKTDGGFTLRQVHPGVFEWHTPAGYAYRVTPGNFGRTQKLTKRSSLPDEPPF
jgi:hypothetical protein